MLQQHDVEAAVVKGKLERAGDLEGHLPALSCALGQTARGLHEWHAEVGTGNPAAVGLRQNARRPADARAESRTDISAVIPASLPSSEVAAGLRLAAPIIYAGGHQSSIGAGR